MAEEKQTNYDVIVVGAGPAGMTAALYASRANLSVLMLDRGIYGGNLNNTAAIENYPGFKTVQGPELAQDMYQGATQFGAQYAYGTVEKVELAGDLKQLTTDMGDVFTAKVLVIATGTQQRHMGVPGEEEYGGRGVSYCAVCDGDFYTGRRVCVAGGGNSALQEAILLSEKCSEVIMLQDLDFFTGEQKLQEVLFAKPNVKTFTGVKIDRFLSKDGELCGLEVERTKTGEVFNVDCDGLFVAIGLIPENEPFRELAELNGFGYFDSDERCETKTPGIYVAGDCRSKTVRQLTTAVADGASAALAACRYLQMR